MNVKNISNAIMCLIIVCGIKSQTCIQAGMVQGHYL